MTLFIEGRILPIAYLRVTDLTQPIILAGFSPFAGGQMLTQSTKYCVADGHTITNLFKDR